jgi:DNA polymerase I-like protein with 3'-5' exonuclease and polymerase domains
MLVAVDIETSCGVVDCPGFGLSNSSKCEHALHHKQNRIDVLGTWDGTDYRVFPTTSAFDDFRIANHWKIVGHNFKFDYKTLKAKGSSITPRDVVGDTQLLASCLKHKIPKEWLEAYNAERKILNEPLPAKQRHRVGTPLSLKTLAPFYLGVPKFWENPVSHDDPAYNRKDCEYTHQLHEKLMGLLDQSGTRKFYEDFLLPWAKLLAEAEYEGVLIDEVLLHRMYAEAVSAAKKLADDVHAELAECFRAYSVGLRDDLRLDSEQRLAKYIETRVKDPDKIPGVTERYAKSLETKIAALPQQFNLQSSAQMLYVCKERGIDVNVEKRDKETNEWIESEGTDKFILKRAKVAGNAFATKMLAMRGKQTEVSYLKQYIEAVVDHRIHCTFNITGTRTGRLSSAGPNLQNVKGALRLPFIVADPSKYSIYTVDSSQIEPRLIAFLTQDEGMVRLFQDGRDYHNYATKKFFPRETEGVDEHAVKDSHNHLRKTAKIGDLSILYGTGKYTFQTMCLVREEMDIPLEQCDAMIQDFRAGMKGVFGWKRGIEEDYKQGYDIFDPLFGCLVQPRDRDSIHMTLFNTEVQGMASRLIFNASLSAWRQFHKLGVDAKPLLWVHDEVVWRFPKGKEDLCKKVVDWHMTQVKLDTRMGLVPLAVEGNISAHWQK